MNGMLINPRTGAAIRSIIGNSPQGILLTGDFGVGLGHVARHMAEQIGDNPHTVRTISPDEKGTITIESIRGLYVATRSKQSSKSVIIIDDSDAMSPPAQNALLKLLEEPTEATVFILTSHRPFVLLPTVRSRVQALEVAPISSGDSRRLLNDLCVDDPVLVRQLLFLAEGRPALMSRLVADNKLQETYLSYAKKAKSFIGGTVYERIAIASKLANDREAALIVLSISLSMLKLQLRQKADKGTLDLTDKMLSAYERITANGNVKAQLLNISL